MNAYHNKPIVYGCRQRFIDSIRSQINLKDFIRQYVGSQIPAHTDKGNFWFLRKVHLKTMEPHFLIIELVFAAYIFPSTIYESENVLLTPQNKPF